MTHFSKEGTERDRGGLPGYVDPTKVNFNLKNLFSETSAVSTTSI